MQKVFVLCAALVFLSSCKKESTLTCSNYDRNQFSVTQSGQTITITDNQVNVLPYTPETRVVCYFGGKSSVLSTQSITWNPRYDEVTPEILTWDQIESSASGGASVPVDSVRVYYSYVRKCGNQYSTGKDTLFFSF